MVHLNLTLQASELGQSTGPSLWTQTQAFSLTVSATSMRSLSQSTWKRRTKFSINRMRAITYRKRRSWKSATIRQSDKPKFKDLVPLRATVATRHSRVAHHKSLRSSRIEAKSAFSRVRATSEPCCKPRPWPNTKQRELSSRVTNRSSFISSRMGTLFWLTISKCIPRVTNLWSSKRFRIFPSRQEVKSQ